MGVTAGARLSDYNYKQHAALKVRQIYLHEAYVLWEQQQCTLKQVQQQQNGKCSSDRVLRGVAYPPAAGAAAVTRTFKRTLT